MQVGNFGRSDFNSGVIIIIIDRQTAKFSGYMVCSPSLSSSHPHTHIITFHTRSHTFTHNTAIYHESLAAQCYSTGTHNLTQSLFQNLAVIVSLSSLSSSISAGHSAGRRCDDPEYDSHGQHVCSNGHQHGNGHGVRWLHS